MSVETYNIDVYGVSFNALPNLPMWSEPSEEHLPAMRAFLRANSEALAISETELAEIDADENALYDLVSNYEHKHRADALGSIVAAAVDARLGYSDFGRGLVCAYQTDTDMLVGIGILRYYPWEQDNIPTMTTRGRDFFEEKLREVLEELGVPSDAIIIEEQFDSITC